MIAICATRAADDPYQNMMLTDGSYVGAVLLRKTDTGYVVATAKGVATLSRNQVRVAPQMTSQTVEIDQILSLIDDFIREGNFRRVPGEIEALKPKIEAYARSNEATLRSVAISADKQKAISTSITFYRDELARIQPTLDILQLASDIREYHNKLRQEVLPFTANTLATIIDFQKRYNAIKVATPLAARDREEAGTQLKELAERCTAELRQLAIKHYAAGYKSKEVIDLLTAFRKGDGISTTYEGEQKAVLDAVIDANRAAIKQISVDVTNSTRFAGGALSTDFAPYRQHRTLIEQTIIPGLEAMAKLTFGSKRAELDQLLAGELTRCHTVLDAQTRRVEQIQASQALFIDAEHAFASRKYAVAVKTYRQFSEKLTPVGLADPAAIVYAGDQALRSEALLYLARIRDSQDLSDDAIETLRADATSFADKNMTRLVQLGFSERDFLAEIKSLALYLQYRRGQQRIVDEMQKDPLTAWKWMLEISKWLEENKGEIQPQALTHWEQFRARAEEGAFTRAMKVFTEGDNRLSDPSDQATFLSFIEKFVERKEYKRALSAIDRALQQGSDQTSPAFINKLLDIQMTIATALSKAGDYPNAAALYQSIATQYPEYATQHGVRTTLATVQVAMAQTLVADGKTKEALALYETVCQNDIAYAARTGILTRILELSSAELGVSPTPEDPLPPALLKVYDRYSRLFPGHLANLPEIRRVKLEITKQFRTAWEEKRPHDAIVRYDELIADYPNLSHEIQVPRQALVAARNFLARLANPLDANGDETTRVTAVPTAVIDAAGELLKRKDTRDLGPRSLTENLYIALLLQRADGFIQIGKIQEAFDVYDRISTEYPEIAKEKNVDQIKADKRWDLQMEKVRRPLGITSSLDWVAFFGWIVIWIAFFIHARRRGKRLGDLTYRMNHFLNTFLVFLVFLVIFLVFRVTHARAFAIAFCLPGFLLNGIGSTTYIFFPLIYHERRLLAEKALLWLFEQSPISGATANLTPAGLRHDIARLEEMVSLMHDRKLFDIHIAIRTSETDAVKGYRDLVKILERLEAEPDHDAAWKQNHSLVVHRLGLIAYRQGNNDDARRYLLAYIEYAPKDLEARQALGDLFYADGLYEDAIPHLKVSLVARNQDEDLWFRLGRCFFETNNPVAAYKCFETSKSKNRNILLYGARSFARANERERAVKWYQVLLKQDPQDSEAIYYLACCIAEMGDSVKAIKVASVIKQDDPYYSSALVLQGNTLFKKDDVQKAGVLFSRALELSPTFVPALVGQGQVLLAEGKLDEARTHFLRILETTPKHPAGNYYLGLIEEKSGKPDAAIPYLKTAADDASFKRWAARRIGYIAYTTGDQATAIEYFGQAEAAGETAPWFLFIYAYVLASKRELRRCEQLLVKIFGRPTGSDQDWNAENVSRAMYSIGVQLFRQDAYKMAHQSFDFVRANPIVNTPLDNVEELIQEARFRMVVNWLERGEYVEAEARCAELQIEAQDKQRYQSCQYYLALCKVYQGQYAEAATLLNALVASHPENPRYCYHQIVAQLGMGDEANARASMNAFAGMSNRPPHLAAGLVTIQAYMNARRGKLQDAERSLARVSLPDGDEPGQKYLREKIILARIFYLCHLHDYDTIKTLCEQLSEEQKSKAIYLQAISSMQANDYQKAIEFLRPFADQSARDRQLFTFLSAQIAIQDLSNGLDADAKDVLSGIPRPPREIASVLAAWTVNDRLADIDDLDSVEQMLGVLRERTGQMEDEYFNYATLHNQAVLLLRRAYLVEDAAVDDEAKKNAWLDAIQFWYNSLFTNPEYWNLAQSRFQDDSRAIKPFASSDIEAINQAAKDKYFVNVFIGFVLYYLAGSDGESLNRHLDLLRHVADEDNKLKVYYRRLGEKVEKYLRAIDKNNPLWNSWGFTIASLDLQIRIADILGLENAAAREQLELYRITARAYESPADYQRDKRNFNTLLLEAIQVGVRGNFTEAGERIEKCLAVVPPGVELGKTLDSLRALRDACRNPAAFAERGINLSHQFEKAYATVRTINIAKGKADAGAKRS